MNFISKALGLGLATWAVTRVLRGAQNQKRERHPEAVTRWEGEGGAIPEVETKLPGSSYAEGSARS